ncbi:VRR-NUC domain-containing protein [Methylorubrum extorquens]|uniref:VRR-NUC domain-containing protein n=1 Tax=Methylorubrum extorquens TaxID=408 RepID=UPI003F5E6C32
MKFKGAAASLGIKHRLLELENGGRKLWRPPGGNAFETVEDAALRIYEASGWCGHAQEGGLILSLIKVASFTEIPLRQRSTFIEATYAQNVGFAEDRFEKSTLINNIIASTATSVGDNFDIISSKAWGRDGRAAPEAFPTVTLEKILGLYHALGRGRLQSIAATSALDPYSYRAGWPDLTLWRGFHVTFKEVKAPGDQLQQSQKRLIQDLLLPLGFTVELVEVSPYPS